MEEIKKATSCRHDNFSLLLVLRKPSPRADSLLLKPPLSPQLAQMRVKNARAAPLNKTGEESVAKYLADSIAGVATTHAVPMRITPQEFIHSRPITQGCRL